MELRYWLLVLCLLAIILIFLDGYRRWSARPKYKGSFLNDPEKVSDFPSAELPSGGARVRPITPEEIVARNESLNLKVKVPILMDSVDLAERKKPVIETETSEPNPQREMELPEPIDEPELDTSHEEDIQTAQEEEFIDNLDLEFRDPNEPKLSLDDDIDSISEPPESTDEAPTHEDEVEERIDLFADNSNEVQMMEPQQLITINVMAGENEYFDGDHLLQILLACGMRFGSMDIFHRTDDDGKLQFSVANCVKPGTFDLNQINQIRLPGVSFFMTLPCAAEAMESFDYMFETANVLARHLHGVMLDESHSTFTAQQVEHCRNQIREFARAQLIPS